MMVASGMTNGKSRLKPELFTEDAPEEEIKRAFREIVKVYHPDKSDPFMKAHNREVFKLLNAAYEDLLSEVAGRE